MQRKGQEYDIIIAGAGCAGLSLAYYLNKYDTRGLRILIIDKNLQKQNDRTWCFWGAIPSEFLTIVTHRWPYLSFADETGFYTDVVGQNGYQHVRSIDFYNFVFDALRSNPNITFQSAFISSVNQDEYGAYVETEDGIIRSKWVFDSSNPLQSKESVKAQYRLLQHFKGWFVKTDQPHFDPNSATLMDFRTAQHGDCRFFYVLPFSETEALVEYTIFSDQLLQRKAYEQEIQRYINQELGISSYQITEEEQGVIPMNSASINKFSGGKVVPIGIKGGTIKPTTGYAFLNILKESQIMARQFVHTGSPVYAEKLKPRFQFYDQVLLRILTQQGGKGKEIFSKLFKQNSIRRVFRFLDEQSTLLDEVKIFSKLPVKLFLEAAAGHLLPLSKNAAIPKTTMQKAT